MFECDNLNKILPSNNNKKPKEKPKKATEK